MKRLLIAIILLIAIPLLIYGSSSTTGVPFGAEVPGIVAAPTCSATPNLSQSSHYDYHWVGDTTSDSYSGFYFRDTVSRKHMQRSFILSPRRLGTFPLILIRRRCGQHRVIIWAPFNEWDLHWSYGQKSSGRTLW